MYKVKFAGGVEAGYSANIIPEKMWENFDRKATNYNLCLNIQHLYQNIEHMDCKTYRRCDNTGPDWARIQVFRLMKSPHT